MEPLPATLLVLAGLAFLFAGGEALVAGATTLARRARISPAVIGLTVVAMGTSVPELVVSLQSAFAGSPGIALGNVFGSNLFNLCAILGLTALVRPLPVRPETLRFECVFLVLSSGLLVAVIQDGRIGRPAGATMLAGLVLFLLAAVAAGRREAARAGGADAALPGRHATWVAVLAVLGGVVLLALGSTALVRGAVSIARLVGLSETVVGLTIVGAGTSTPELVTSLVAALRGRSDVAVTNLLGSNVFNVLAIAGGVAVIHPLAVPPELVLRDGWWVLATALVLVPLLLTGRTVSRAEGGLLLATFLVYTGVVLTGGAPA